MPKAILPGANQHDTEGGEAYEWRREERFGRCGARPGAFDSPPFKAGLFSPV